MFSPSRFIFCIPLVRFNSLQENCYLRTVFFSTRKMKKKTVAVEIKTFLQIMSVSWVGNFQSLLADFHSSAWYDMTKVRVVLENKTLYIICTVYLQYMDK